MKKFLAFLLLTVMPATAQPNWPIFVRPGAVDAVIHGDRAVTEGAEMSVYRRAVAYLVTRQEWSQLEQEIARLRKSEPTFSSGNYKATSFYAAFEETNELPFLRRMDAHMEDLGLWLKSQPQSAAARVGLARCLLMFVEGRVKPRRDWVGTPFTSTLMKDPAASALRLLAEARKLEPDDAEIWAQSIRALHLTQSPPALANPILQVAEQRWPEYFPVVAQRIRYRLMRDAQDPWWEIQCSPQTLARAWGLELNSWRPFNQASWSRLQAGFESAVQAYPNSRLVHSLYAKAAMNSKGALEIWKRETDSLKWVLEPSVLSSGFLTNAHNWRLPEEPQTAQLPAFDPLVNRSAVPMARVILAQQTQDLFLGMRFAELDAIGIRIREEQPRFADGSPVLTFWDDVIRDNPLEQRGKGTHENYLLQQWLSANPGSVDANLASAWRHLDAAWKARGGGVASSIQPDQLEEMSSEMAEAEQRLLPILYLKHCPDPNVYALAINLALNHADPQSEAEIYLQKAIEADPKSSRAYLGMANLLLPRWHGRPGDLQKFFDRGRKTFGPGLEGLFACTGGRALGVASEENLTDSRVLNSLQQLAQSRGYLEDREIYAIEAQARHHRRHFQQALKLLSDPYNPQVFSSDTQRRLFLKWMREK